MKTLCERKGREGREGEREGRGGRERGKEEGMKVTHYTCDMVEDSDIPCAEILLRFFEGGSDWLWNRKATHLIDTSTQLEHTHLSSPSIVFRLPNRRRPDRRHASCLTTRPAASTTTRALLDVGTLLGH